MTQESVFLSNMQLRAPVEKLTNNPLIAIILNITSRNMLFLLYMSTDCDINYFHCIHFLLPNPMIQGTDLDGSKIGINTE